MLSVIIPTHNPRAAYLKRVVDALRAQTLDKQKWELLVVDNRSDVPVENSLDLSWHPKGKVIREDKLGLTHARLRGIDETKGDPVVFVDDDNVLEKDYLAKASDIAAQLPWLGVYGGGTEAEFEIPPPNWTRNIWGMLAVRTCTRTIWGNDRNQRDSFPDGAGMCLRREAAKRYVENVDSHPLRSNLGRTGEQLMSGEDHDIVYTCLHEGYGMGRFKELQLKHLIPKERLDPAYLLRLSEGMGYTKAILDFLWPPETKNNLSGGLVSLLNTGAIAVLRELRKHKFTRAHHRGAARAAKYLSTLDQDTRGRG